MLFMVIPYLMVPPMVSSAIKKIKWKPSKREFQEAFLLHLKTASELQPTLERRRAKCQQIGETLQPLPIVIGTSESTLKAYIAVETFLFTLDSVLSCVDVCFKLFHSLQVKYPSESQHLWYFLQKFVYNIKEAGDKDYLGVNSLITDLTS